VHIQLDDMRMPQSPHVLDLPLDSCLGLRHVNDSLGDVLHSDLLTGDGMHCLYEKCMSQPYTAIPSISRRDVLLTLPNVPSAISPITVYSPSFEAGKMVSFSLMRKIRRLSWKGSSLSLPMGLKVLVH
jgi:hypothetical protein